MWEGELIDRNDCGNVQQNLFAPQAGQLRNGWEIRGRGKPKWNYGELSLPNWWGFIRHCQGQRIEVISFFMHGFCPHRDLKRRKRERAMREYTLSPSVEERDERKGEEWRRERRSWKGEGRAEESRDKVKGGEKGDEWEGEKVWQADV